jgi:hypothetical protein
VNPICGSFVGAFEEMPVHVENRVHVGVSEAVGNGTRMLTNFDQESDVAVPQIMESQPLG